MDGDAETQKDWPSSAPHTSHAPVFRHFMWLYI